VPDLLDAYQRQTAQIRQRLEQVIRATWGGLSSFRDADMAAWEKRVIPIVLAAEKQTATLTDAYLTRVAAKAAPKALKLSAVTGDVLRGVPMDEVYHRPAVTVYTTLSKGQGVDQAVQAGLVRALSLAMTDVQLSKTHAARANQSGRGVRYFKRTLTGSENCALCVIASTQRYHVGDLSPIHPGCDCGVDDVKAGEDPGQVIAPDLLEAAHDAVAKSGSKVDRGGRDTDYRKLIVVRQHGEYGPTLAVRGQHFEGPADI